MKWIQARRSAPPSGVPGHRIGARVRWTEGGDLFHRGTVIEILNERDVRVRWDDRHRGEWSGWYVLGEKVEAAPEG